MANFREIDHWVYGPEICNILSLSKGMVVVVKIIRQKAGKADLVDEGEGSSLISVKVSYCDTTGVLDQIMFSQG